MPNDESPEVSIREAEELFMTNADASRQRIAVLLPERWKELVAPTAALGRRARTMGVCAALDETLQLARLSRHAEDEDTAKLRGEKMLPDVVEETRSIVGDDRALKARPELRAALIAALPTAEGPPTMQEVARLESLSSHLRGEYLQRAEEALCRHFTDSPSLVEFEEGLEQLAAHARGLGHRRLRDRSGHRHAAVRLARAPGRPLRGARDDRHQPARPHPLARLPGRADLGRRHLR